MDDQAEKLRQLVRAVRHPTTIATGPISIVVSCASDHTVASSFLSALRDHCTARGIAHDNWELTRITDTDQDANLQRWQQASAAIVLTYGDEESIVDTYKTLKFAADAGPLPPLELVVLSDDDGLESAAAQRLSLTCSRFLHANVLDTTITSTADYRASSVIVPMIDRWLLMAPVAHATPVDLNSPLASQGSLPL